jgi:hypothetical protein
MKSIYHRYLSRYGRNLEASSRSRRRLADALLFCIALVGGTLAGRLSSFSIDCAGEQVLRSADVHLVQESSSLVVKSLYRFIHLASFLSRTSTTTRTILHRGNAIHL